MNNLSFRGAKRSLKLTGLKDYLLSLLPLHDTFSIAHSTVPRVRFDHVSVKMQLSRHILTHPHAMQEPTEGLKIFLH